MLTSSCRHHSFFVPIHSPSPAEYDGDTRQRARDFVERQRKIVTSCVMTRELGLLYSIARAIERHRIQCLRQDEFTVVIERRPESIGWSTRSTFRVPYFGSDKLRKYRKLWPRMLYGRYRGR